MRVGVGGGIEIFTNYLLIPPNIYTDKFLLKVEISTFGVPKERIAYQPKYIECSRSILGG